jgi:hypothetical protein
VYRDEDPRDYRVCFDKIKNQLGYTITRTVPVGVQEILTCLRMGIIENPDDHKYYNTPVAQVM